MAWLILRHAKRLKWKRNINAKKKEKKGGNGSISFIMSKHLLFLGISQKIRLYWNKK